MELTNFIWHLGAALAAIWAGLAHRSLKIKLNDLEQGVLASLLENEGEVETHRAPAYKRRRVSARARALRWFSSDLARSRGIQVEFANRQALYDLPQGDWCLAVRRLSVLLTDKAFCGASLGRICQLSWLSEGTAGRWVVENWKGGEHG
ncbi:MAG: hypothetical protein RJB13_1352 [Pseudomonadota bacterium]|jgi:hypothetical protein